MNRCLNERALLQIYTREGTVAEQSHLRLCADCAERYESLVQDLETIGRVLEAPPPVWEDRRVSAWRLAWIPAAVACAALLLVSLDVASVRRSSPVQVARGLASDAVLAADLSNALFANSDANALSTGIVEVSYLDAALDAGHPCTQERFLDGDCDDQLSAFMIESE